MEFCFIPVNINSYIPCLALKLLLAALDNSNVQCLPAINFQALRKSVLPFAGVPTFDSSMLTESDNNVTITMEWHFLSAPIVRVQD